MSRAEYDAMVKTGRVQPTVEGLDMKHVTAPPDSSGYRAAARGRIFVEFDVVDPQIAPGGRIDWFVIYGPNSDRGRLAARRGQQVADLPLVRNMIITETE